MQWLNSVVLVEASGDVVLSALNCVYFGRLAAASRTAGRRVAAAALCVVSGGLSLEAALYLALSSPAGGLEQVAVLAVRSALLAGAGFVSLLIWRHGGQHRA